MKILHLAVHLGGGIGRTHSALAAVMPPGVEQTFLLLQPPVDQQYAAPLRRRARIVVGDHRDAVRLARDADLVQVEYWGHPALEATLLRLDLAGARVVVWCHVSCLHAPRPPAWLVGCAARFVYTSPVSMRPGLDYRFCVVSSGFGLAAPPDEWRRRARAADVIYLGTVDHKKMHPGAFTALDAVDVGRPVVFYGRTSEEVRLHARMMRHPGRAVMADYTEAPRTVLERTAVLYYPLRRDHYGTGENALVEAMSLGVVPVVMRNPAECDLVEDGVSGVVVDTPEEGAEAVRLLLADAGYRMTLAQGAAAAVRDRTPARAAVQLMGVWRSVLAGRRLRQSA